MPMYALGILPLIQQLANFEVHKCGMQMMLHSWRLLAESLLLVG